MYKVNPGIGSVSIMASPSVMAEAAELLKEYYMHILKRSAEAVFMYVSDYDENDQGFGFGARQTGVDGSGNPIVNSSLKDALLCVNWRSCYGRYWR